MPSERSGPQNRIFHAICGEVSKQAMFAGRKRSAQQWKVLFVSALQIVQDEGSDVVCGLEGEFVQLRESTARMSSARMATLIDYAQAWAALNGVELQK